MAPKMKAMKSAAMSKGAFADALAQGIAFYIRWTSAHW